MIHKYRFFLLLFLILVSNNFLNAQKICGTDEIHQHLLATDTNYVNEVQQREAEIRQIYQNGLPKNVTYPATIPVVVHVFYHPTQIATVAYPSDAEIIAAIQTLNDYFEFNPEGDADFRFVMAARDDSDNPTNGIVRKDVTTFLSTTEATTYKDDGVFTPPSGNGIDPALLRAESQWDRSKYYNIWVVNTIEGAGINSGGYRLCIF